MEKDNKKKSRKKIFHKIKHKSRLVVMNDDTFEEQFSLILSPLNVFTWGGVFLLFFAACLILLIAFTPLREFIPGYADVNTRKMATYAAIKADSVQQALARDSVYLQNIKLILSGQEGITSDTLRNQENVTIENIDLSKSREDSILRNQVEEEERFNVHSREGIGKNDLDKILLFPPLKGLVTSQFNPAIKHFGVDVVPTSEDAAVSAAYSGVVIQSSWTSGEGHVLYIQHSGDLVSVYKHNSVLLKKVGENVKSGEAIAIVGNSGELSSGPHLHFELWHKGAAINPENYIVF